MSWGITIFCDDIRYEVGGKKSFMGIYNGAMIVESFPVLLPKLAFSIRFMERFGESDAPVTFTLSFPGQIEPVATINFERQGSPVNLHTVADAELEQRLEMTPEFFLSPVQIIEAGYIKVRATRGQETFKIGALQILAASEAPSQQVASAESALST
ncbi:MAG: hypothetical protein ACYDD1_12415 [Caulobacteraceae bacterium]